MRKYVWYAFGEIMLVMVGILLALQVNNWNLDRLDKQKERETLSDLKVEFEANLSDITRVLNQHNITYAELQQVQRITLEQKFEDPRLDSLFFALIKWFDFTDRPGASSNLINSGNLNLISNDELRDLITKWPGTVNDIVDDEQYTITFVRETVSPFLAGRYPISNLEIVNRQFVSSFGQPLDPQLNPVMPLKEVNWKELLEDQEFQSILSVRLLNEYHCILEGKLVLENNVRILELISQELNN